MLNSLNFIKRMTFAFSKHVQKDNEVTGKILRHPDVKI